MEFLRLNDNWITIGSEENIGIDFPRDELIFREKDYSRASGSKNGFYRSETFKVRKRTDFPKAHRLYLSVEGVMDVADIFVGADCVATVTNPCKHYIDVSKYMGTTGEITMSFSTPEFADEYRGLGLSGEIGFLKASKPLFIEADGVFFTTVKTETKTELSCRAEIVNDTDEKKYFAVTANLYNARGRRVGKRTRKLRLAPHSAKTFLLPVRLGRSNEWSISDAYLYTGEVVIYEGQVAVDSAKVPVGIRTAALLRDGFMLGGRPTRFFGAVVPHTCGIVGRCSFPEAEAKKAAVLKDCGYNSVRYIGLPTEAALCALDKAGLTCIVEIFDVLSQPKTDGDRHAYFDRDFRLVAENGVRTLRKHPCVVGYGICDVCPESYGRGRGAQLGKEIVSLIRELDDTRFIVATAGEFAPDEDEMLKAGVRPERIRAAEREQSGLISLAREKNMFRDFTADWFTAGDVRGYSCLYQRYQTDIGVSPTPILGVAARAERIADALEESERFGVLGEFVDPVMDKQGSLVSGDGMTGKRSSTDGEIDLTLRRKSRSYYREIALFGGRQSKIVVLDPEDEENELSGRESWNLPRYLGKPVTVKVYTGGDIVALYLDGRQIGRKLAGKINKRVATFTVNYYPGKLEAVSFRKGSEYCRAELETTTSPKAIKLSCENKNVSLSAGGIAFVEITVTDKEGRTVSKAQRSVEVSVLGDGEIYALSNADPELMSSAGINCIPVYESRALVAVKGLCEGKMKVKVTGEGLLSSKITVKVKP